MTQPSEVFCEDDFIVREKMPSPSAAEMKVTWNYGRRGGLSDDSIEFWIGDERIAHFSGTKEALDMMGLALLDLRTQPEIVKRTKPEKMTLDEMRYEIDDLRREVFAREYRIRELERLKERLESE